MATGENPVHEDLFRRVYPEGPAYPEHVSVVDTPGVRLQVGNMKAPTDQEITHRSINKTLIFTEGNVYYVSGEPFNTPEGTSETEVTEPVVDLKNLARAPRPLSTVRSLGGVSFVTTGESWIVAGSDDMMYGTSRVQKVMELKDDNVQALKPGQLIHRRRSPFGYMADVITELTENGNRDPKRVQEVASLALKKLLTY